MLQWLQGKKTYIVAISAILGAVSGIAAGAIPIDVGINTIVTSLLGMTIGAKVDRTSK